ncbi:4a-hydroxytetrahydrobiopterin dehydratase [Roseicyclus sp. F158]|uniref:Putative pterin-4-alpha-carbinolamine dehydratase n=1 Tax=Tropicimonas omnivorans TaxID=3075590 RepID=A0ABU3DET0_9RHOB|nr:4a-hydroxytetrahydrobiopterin dehydratase [Roseicyclus sp. F158]MDT0682063.1 4a-hydroxytetrahydrobiopterin dehydratase [Roseicyclus sp. F158]
MRPERLTDRTALEPLLKAGWTLAQDREAIEKTFRFADFRAAFGWMTSVALMAEKLDHHPEWRNVYRTVEVTLVTHSANGLTELDIRLATEMDKLAE